MSGPRLNTPMNWNNLTRVTPAATPVIDTETAINYVRASEDDEEMIAGLVEAATAMIEGPNGIGTALITSGWKASFDTLPSSLSIALTPVQSVDKITVLTDDGNVEVDLDLIHVAGDQHPAQIAFLTERPVAKRLPGSVTVEFKAGYGDTPEMVPADLRHAVLWLVAHMYENRGDDASKSVIPPTVDRVLNRYRRF